MTVQIPLTQGYTATIDEADLPLVNQYKWRICQQDQHMYARTRDITMHRLIMGVIDKPSARIHHINGNTLDNRRANLRQCEHCENQRNRRKCRKPTSSQYKGVSLSRTTGRWLAYIHDGKPKRHLGYFTHETDAAEAYDAAARDSFGEFARLNFPEVEAA